MDQGTTPTFLDPQPPSPSRHSPPSSRSFHRLPHPQLEGLGGGLSEVWTLPAKWDQYKLYLAGLEAEGEDSNGQPLDLQRYATFLELFVELYREWREGAGQDRLRGLVRGVVEHQEGFLDRERCLSCVDQGLRRDVMEAVRRVEGEEEDPGPAVFLPIYPRIVDKLSELLGVYQNKLLFPEKPKQIPRTEFHN